MTIQSIDNYLEAARQRIPFSKTSSRTTVGLNWFSLFDLAGNPGAGTLAGSSTTAGVVPTDAANGCPIINPFGGGARGILSKVEFYNTVACRLMLVDCLFKAGAYAFNANQALSSQPSYSSRIPGGTYYTGLEIWAEQVTAATGIQNINVTYTNDQGVGSRSTGTIAFPAAPIVGRMMQLPLQAGDSGVQKIDNVVGSVASAGTFNILVLRPLWTARVQLANYGDVHDLLRTGAPEVYNDSALMLLCNADSTASGFPDLELEVSNG